MQSTNRLDFAYRYPFSEEAKELVAASGAPADSIPYLKLAKARIEEGIASGSIAYKGILYGQRESVMGYVYARLMASALPQGMLNRYVLSEARRSCSAMSSDSDASVARLLTELGIKVSRDSDAFSLDAIQFLMNSPESDTYALVNQRLKGGAVRLELGELAGMMVKPIAERIMRGLPIPRKDIPKIVLEYSKEVKLPKEELRMVQSLKSIRWIDRLLLNPIPDVRQRVVGLVLAPYLVNVRGLDIDSAYKVISSYIDKCKAIDPSTRITDAQIRYQCSYAKSKGMRPLSLKKAEELLSPVINMEALEGG